VTASQLKQQRTHSGLFSGVLVPVLTPFDDQLLPDQGRYLDLCSRLLDRGADGLAVFGTTSEGNSLSVDERKRLIKCLVEEGIPGEKLMPGIGACSLTETVELLTCLGDAGVGGALLLPPFYYKEPVVRDDGLFQFVAEVMRRTKGVTTKIYLYHIPPVAHIGWSVELVGRILDAYADRVVGLKDSSGDWNNTRALIEAYPNLDVFPGSEVFLLDALRIGGAGCITATGNLNPAGIRSICDASDDTADAVQGKVTKVRLAVQNAGPPIPVMKSYLALKTGDSNWARVRPPLLPAHQDVPVELDEALSKLDFGFDVF